MNDQVHMERQPSFSTVAYGRCQVERLSPAAIDEMLAHGWFRSDLTLNTSVTRYLDHEWKPCVMLRIPLAGFVWKKRMRKLLRRNDRQFRVLARPFQARPTLEQLWQRFKTAVHAWGYVPNLSHHLFRGRPPGNFQTWEMSVYHGKKLVAFSLFDRGERSIASLEAAYDPDYQQYSLGMYTMLLELRWAAEQEMGWYYPGFYPQGTPMFDYKLRPGGVEFLRWHARQWVPWEEIQPQDWVYREISEKLDTLHSLLTERGVWATLHRSFQSNVPGEQPKASDYNVYLETILKKTGDIVERSRLAWDIFSQQYQVFSQILKPQGTGDAENGQQVFPLDAYQWRGAAQAAGQAANLVSAKGFL